MTKAAKSRGCALKVGELARIAQSHFRDRSNAISLQKDDLLLCLREASLATDEVPALCLTRRGVVKIYWSHVQVMS